MSKVVNFGYRRLIRSICYGTSKRIFDGFRPHNTRGATKRLVWEKQYRSKWYGRCVVCSNMLHATDFSVIVIGDTIDLENMYPTCTNCPLDMTGSTE